MRADDGTHDSEEAATAFTDLKLENKTLVCKSTNQIQENVARSLYRSC